MESINQYGDLSDKEFRKFLAEIQGNNEDIEEAEAQAKLEIEEKETQFLPSDETREISENGEISENSKIEAYYGNDAWRMFPKYIGKGIRPICLYGPEVKQRAIQNAAISRRKAFAKKAQKDKEERIRIQRLAFSQDFIHLNDIVEKPVIRKLISALTEEHTMMIDKHSNFINRRLTTLLRPLIPQRLKACSALFPDSIRKCPGFLYKASEAYHNLTFWATPQIPYFFKQNTEQKALLKCKPEFLESIDKSVFSYHEHLRKRQEKEIKYASILIQKKVHTYFDVLKFNPFWFEILYNKLKSEAENE